MTQTGSVTISGAGAPEADTNGDVARLARGGTLSMVGAASYAVLSFVLLMVVTRGLGAAGAGAFMQAIGIFAILNITAVLGTETGLIRGVTRARALGHEERIAPTLWVALVPVFLVSLAMSAGLLLFTDEVAGMLSRGTHVADIAQYLRVMAPFLPISTVYMAVLGATRGFGRMRTTVFVDKMAKPALQPLLVLVAILSGAPAWAVAIGWVTPWALAFVPAAVALQHLLKGTRRSASDKPPPTAVLFREFWRFTLPRTFANAFKVIAQWLDVILVGAMVSASAAGIYAAATRLLLVSSLAMTAISQVAQPMLSRFLAADRPDRAKGVYQTTAAWLIALAWPIHFAAAIFGAVLLQLFGQEFTEGATVLLILAVARLPAMAVGPVDMVLLMGGKSWMSMANTMVALSLNAFFNVLLIPRYGIIGAAMAWSVSTVFYQLAPLIQVAVTLKLHPFGRGSAYAVAGAIGCYLIPGVAIRTAMGLTLPAFVVFAVVSTLLYVAFLIRFRTELQVDTYLASVLRRRQPVRQGEQGRDIHTADQYA